MRPARELDVLFLAVDAAQSREIMAGPRDPRSRWSSTTRAPSAWPMASRSSSPRRTRTRLGTARRQPHRQSELHDRRGGRRPGTDPRPRRPRVGRPRLLPGGQRRGPQGLDAFEAERGTDHRDPADGSPFHGRIADSVVPQIDVLDDDGWTGEEKKIHAELRKILEMPDLDVAATTVRVPVHTGHSVALHIRTERETTVEELEAALRDAPGLEYRPADGSERHPMPLDVEGRGPVLAGRLRAIPGRERGFALWVSSDNLRKGAALNAIQSAAAADPERAPSATDVSSAAALVPEAAGRLARTPGWPASPRRSPR